MGQARLLGLMAKTLIVTVLLPPALATGAPADTHDERQAIRSALKLIPGGSTLVVRIIDPDLVGDPDAVRALDAFIVRERDGSLRQIVYINRASSMFRDAVGGSALALGILAAVIHHEAAHLGGADEATAAAAERRLFQQLLATGGVPLQDGLTHLARLHEYQKKYLNGQC